ncbi:MAG: helix-turn-helix domain-containing protein [Actinomycetota bacterium]|jgi:DNA-binding HxlR family transcriptional regulator|nr:helix-turn-helix domain-containing protein [Actinomycetota bacterium]
MTAGDTPEAIDRTLRVIGDRWSILIVRAALRGIRRFDDFCDDLGIARPILTQRLRRLVSNGVMIKVPYQEHPLRHEYRLTDAGIALSPVLVALVRWSEEHADGTPSPTALVHAPCGTELEQAFWCRRCRTTFGPAAIRGVERAAGDVGSSKDVPDGSPAH